MRWQAFNTFLMLFLIGLFLTVFWIQLHSHPVALPGEKDSQGIEYKDFITILLTALAVMIAIATILIAAAAIWGFGVAREVAESVAIRTARETTVTETSAQEAKSIAREMEGGDNDD